jgi:hypothetical protein
VSHALDIVERSAYNEAEMYQYDINFIAQVTGLTAEEIETL